MSWESESWKQNDSDFYGYPIPTQTASTPDRINRQELPTKWIFDNEFYGYPHIVRLKEKAAYPIITGFFISGMGADFRQINKNLIISLPEQIHFQFRMEDL